MRRSVFVALIASCVGATGCGADGDDEPVKGAAATGGGAASGAGGGSGSNGAGGSAAGGGGTSGSGGSLSEPGSQPFPKFGGAQRLVDGLTQPVRVEVKDGFVYWTEMGEANTGVGARLARVPVMGGTSETLYSGTQLTSLHLDDESLFFGERGNNTIREMQYGARVTTVFATLPAKVGDMDRVGGELYYTYFDTESLNITGIGHRPISGSAPHDNGASRSSGLGIYTYAASTGSRFFINVQGATNSVEGIVEGRSATSTTEIIHRAGVGHLAVDAKYLYFASQDENTLFRYPYTRSGAVEEALSTTEQRPFAVAVDGAGIYFTNTADCFGVHNELGSVIAVGHDVASRVTLAANQSCPQAIAADASAVFWANRGSPTVRGSGSLMRAPKL